MNDIAIVGEIVETVAVVAGFTTLMTTGIEPAVLSSLAITGKIGFGVSATFGPGGFEQYYRKNYKDVLEKVKSIIMTNRCED